MTTLIISNKKMKEIIKTVKSLKESGVSETVEKEEKNKKADFLAYY